MSTRWEIEAVKALAHELDLGVVLIGEEEMEVFLGRDTVLTVKPKRFYGGCSAPADCEWRFRVELTSEFPPADALADRLRTSLALVIQALTKPASGEKVR